MAHSSDEARKGGVAAVRTGVGLGAGRRAALGYAEIGFNQFSNHQLGGSDERCKSTSKRKGRR
jgi:hypothetical protein